MWFNVLRKECQFAICLFVIRLEMVLFRVWICFVISVDGEWFYQRWFSCFIRCVTFEEMFVFISFYIFVADSLVIDVDELRDCMI